MYSVFVCVPYRKFGERRVVDPPSEGVLLELQQLDHQPSEGLTGGGVVLDVLQQHNTRHDMTRDEETLRTAENTLTKTSTQLLNAHLLLGI